MDTALGPLQGALMLVSRDSWLGREAGASEKLLNAARCGEMNGGLHLWWSWMAASQVGCCLPCVVLPAKSRSW